MERQAVKKDADTRIALIGIMVYEKASVPRLNTILSEYAAYIVGRMGLPHLKDELSVISIAVEAEGDIISTLSGKIGQLKGISSKVLYAKQ